MAADEELLRALVAACADGRGEEIVAAGADVERICDQLRPLADVGDELVVEWLARNVERVDARVTGSGREWRVVYACTPEGRIVTAHADERPPPFAGVDGGLAVVVNGPSGAGKSSLMAALLEAAGTPWVAFDEPWLGTVRQPYLIWRHAAPRLHTGFLEGIAALARSGNQVILSSGGVPFPAVEDAFAGVPTLTVGLDCPLSVLHQRERGRPGRWGGLAEDSLGVHEGWTYAMRLDTSTAPPGELARRVLTAASELAPRPG